MPTGLNKSREELPWLYYPRSNSVRVINSHLGGGGGGGFTPTDIADICTWHDASDTATVLNAVSPDVAASNNQTVRRWLDKSGNGFHLNQTTSANQPIFKTGQFNGLPAIDFDSSNDGMATTCVLTAPYTIFLVALQRSASSVRIVNTNDATNSLLSFARTNNCVFVSGANVRATPFVSTSVLAAAFLHSPSIGGGNHTLYLNDANTNLATSSRAAANFGTLALGSGAIYTEIADALVCELATYTRNLSESERQELAGYAIAKWGIT